MCDIYRARAGVWLLAVALALPAPAHAGHSITELYNPFYVVGVALVVVLSFVVVALLVTHADRLRAWPTLRLSRAGAAGPGLAGRLAMPFCGRGRRCSCCS